MASLERVREYIMVSELEKNIEQTITPIIEQMIKILIEKGDIDEEMIPEIEKYKKSTIRKVIKAAMRELEKIFTELLSDKELDELITFNSSQVAVHMRELQSEVAQRIKDTVREELTQKLMPEKTEKSCPEQN